MSERSELGMKLFSEFMEKEHKEQGARQGDELVRYKQFLFKRGRTLGPEATVEEVQQTMDEHDPSWRALRAHLVVGLAEVGIWDDPKALKLQRGGVWLEKPGESRTEVYARAGVGHPVIPDDSQRAA